MGGEGLSYCSLLTDFLIFLDFIRVFCDDARIRPDPLGSFFTCNVDLTTSPDSPLFLSNFLLIAFTDIPVLLCSLIMCFYRCDLTCTTVRVPPIYSAISFIPLEPYLCKPSRNIFCSSSDQGFFTCLGRPLLSKSYNYCCCYNKSY